MQRRIWAEQVKEDPEHTFFVGDFRATEILSKARRNNPILKDILDQNGIQRGVSPDYFDAHVMPATQAKSEHLESGCIRMSISGEQIKPYRDWTPDQAIIYVGRDDDVDLYPKALKHIETYRNEISCSEVKERKHPWWALHRKRDPEIFNSPKFIGLTTSKTVNLLYDAKDSLVVTDAMFVFRLKDRLDPDIVLAVMQSSPFLFFYRVANQGEQRVIPQLKAAKLESLPFPAFGEQEKQGRVLFSLVSRAHEITRAMESAKSKEENETIKAGLGSVLSNIDDAVCEAYGLTSEDAAYIRGWLKGERQAMPVPPS
ncbi:MAG: hypothetical protein JRN58_01870 [Nitrososphaerota archaeon]|nr:hypothetical protein [Nitrososphaerota archaeon]